MFVTLSVALTLLIRSTKAVYWAPACVRQSARRGCEWPRHSPPPRWSQPRVPRSAPPCAGPASEAQLRLRATSSCSAGAVSHRFLYFPYLAHNSWSINNVDKIHEGGGVHLVAQPLSTLFTVFFIWGPVAQPMGSLLADQWPNPGPWQRQQESQPLDRQGPITDRAKFKMNYHREFFTYMDAFQAPQMADSKSLMQIRRQAGYGEIFCYLGLHKKNLQIPNGRSHFKQSTVCNITFSFTFQGSCLILESETQQ